MEYREFVDYAQERLSALHPNLAIAAQQMEKLQGESYYGLTIKVPGSNIATSINLQDLYRQVAAGENAEQVILEFSADVPQLAAKAPAFDVHVFEDYETALEHLFLQVVPQKGNEKLLADTPHETVGDMAMVYRIHVPDVSASDASILVKRPMLELWQVDYAQFHADAMEHCPKNNPAKIRLMSEVLAQIAGISMDEMPPMEPELYVASCRDVGMGAGCICYPEFMEQAAKEVGGNFYLLPSSIHECILVKEGRNIDYRELGEMVRSINEETVAPCDRLSDTAYHYDAKERRFEKADDYARRKKKEQHRDIER